MTPNFRRVLIAAAIVLVVLWIGMPLVAQLLAVQR